MRFQVFTQSYIEHFWHLAELCSCSSVTSAVLLESRRGQYTTKAFHLWSFPARVKSFPLVRPCFFTLSRILEKQAKQANWSGIWINTEFKVCLKKVPLPSNPTFTFLYYSRLNKGYYVELLIGYIISPLLISCMGLILYNSYQSMTQLRLHSVPIWLC